jgi:hypothetical protein
MELDELIKQYNISDVDIKKNMLQRSENAYRTSAKELICNKLIKRGKLFERFCKSMGWQYNGYKKISSAKMQRAGVDFVIHCNINGMEKDIYIDLKGCVGTKYDFAPVEIYQNNQFTNTKSKLTDYMLYIAVDDYKPPRFRFISYDEICRYSLTYKHKVEYNGDIAFFKRHPDCKISNNGSGEYVVSDFEIKELI